ncbi:uncharacterized protein N7518_003114, partial [Penicillium psychrosexuale]|uniref:uncharacterized protein n=1 Tax=Penicillium psychrosexuale TaxID=1002107 RepID=UPI002544DA2A
VLEGIQYLRGRGRALAALSTDTILLTESGGVRIGYSYQIDTAEIDAVTLKLFALAKVIKRLIIKNPPHYHTLITWFANSKHAGPYLELYSIHDFQE